VKLVQIVFAITLVAAVSLHAAVADLVVFSYDRPIQLYAFLESVEALSTGLGEVHVIYRADSDAVRRAYVQVAKDFQSVRFHKQGINPKADFKPLTMKASFESPSHYVIFAVDDIIAKDFINLSDSIELLEKENAYAFYLRMGRNLDWCYSMNDRQILPPMKEISPTVYAWTFREGIHDWNYPHSVDMTLFRKRDIQKDLTSLNFNNPNTFEGAWASLGGRVSHRKGLCYGLSKIVNIPLNRVQTTYENRNMGLYSAGELLSMFNDGKKIHVAPLFRIQNPSAHFAYEPTFVSRTGQKVSFGKASNDDL
jgi:hypothetical protein